MNRIERFLTIISGTIISFIVFIGFQILLPFPYGLAVGTIIAMKLDLKNKSSLNSKSQYPMLL